MEKTPAPPVAVLVLAAGKGTRMHSDLPKVLHPIGGTPMLSHVLGASLPLEPDEVIVVVAKDALAVREAARNDFKGVRFAEQTEQRGTGDAVRCGLDALPKEWDGIVLVAFGDTPLLPTEAMQAAVSAVSGDTALAILGMKVAGENAYGRIIHEADGSVAKIVEFKDATAKERKVLWCNSGILAARASLLRELLPKLTPANKQGELYLTDVVGLARSAGHRCAMVEGNAADLAGVNSKTDLAAMEAAFQNRKRAEMLAKGVTLVSPETVFFAYDTVIGRDCVVEPFVVFGTEVTIGDNVTIRAFSHIEGAEIGEKAKVGPYARLRPGTELGKAAQVGNFVELKKTKLDAGAKASHLSYLGDAIIGANTNIGAGTITCNYDGYSKHITRIGKQVFVGSNSALVAPLDIGDGAIIAAGSIVTDDVEADSLAISRSPQKSKPGWAKLFRNARNN